MLHTNCHALHFTLPSDAKIQRNAVVQARSVHNSKKKTAIHLSCHVWFKLHRSRLAWARGCYVSLDPPEIGSP